MSRKEDSKGRMLLGSLPPEVLRKLKSSYAKKSHIFEESVRPIFLRETRHSPESDAFRFHRKSENEPLMNEIMTKLIGMKFTVDHLVEAFIAMGDFGMAKEYLRKYVRGQNEEKLRGDLNDAIQRQESQEQLQRDLNKAIKRQKRLETFINMEGSSTKSFGVYAPYEMVYSSLFKLFSARIFMASLMKDDLFGESEDTNQEIEEMLTGLSCEIPVTLYPSQNAIASCRNFFLNQCLSPTSPGLTYVTNRVEIQLTNCSYNDFCQLGVLLSHNLWTKTIPCSDWRQRCDENEQDSLTEVELSQQSEMAILQCLQHSHIVQLAGVIISPLALHLLFHQHGSGHDLAYILKHKLYKPEDFGFLWRVTWQLCNAVQYLHCHQPFGVFHNNILCNNVILDDELKNIRLCGFSRACCAQPICPGQTNNKHQEFDLIGLGKLLQQFMDYMNVNHSQQGQHIRNISEVLQTCTSNSNVTIMTAVYLLRQVAH